MSKLVILLGFCLAITYLLDFGACESSPLSAAAGKVASPSHFRAFRGRDVDDDDERYFQKRQMDDYGHMRFGKRQNQDFDDYGHMRFGK